MATDLAIVRVLMGGFAETIVSDVSIQIYIDETSVSGTVRRKSAAALGLTALAGSQALLEKLREVLNYKGDNRGISKALLATAQDLRDLEENEPHAVVAEQAWSSDIARRILDNRFQEAGF